MHFEAMVRMQQKEELALHAKREAEAQADERIRRTAREQPASLSHSERMYQQALEQQAKLERQAMEREREREAMEMQESTFAPSISAGARKLRTDERPVEQRVMDWHEAKETRLREAVADSPTADPKRSLVSTPSSGVPPRRKGNPQFTGGKKITTSDF